MESIYAVIDENNEVINIVLWDGNPNYQPDGNTILIPLPFVDEVNEETGETVRAYSGGIGWHYVDGDFVDDRAVEAFN